MIMSKLDHKRDCLQPQASASQRTINTMIQTAPRLIHNHLAIQSGFNVLDDIQISTTVECESIVFLGKAEEVMHERVAGVGIDLHAGAIGFPVR